MILDLVKLANQDNNSHPHIGSLLSAHQYLLLYKLFKKYVPKGSAVLDWGAGNGHFSYFLCTSGYQTTGFSFEQFSFKKWLKSYSYKFIKGNPNQPTKLPFNNNCFKAVASVGVLEHVGEYAGTQIGSMKEIARILKPNGFFICYHLPNYYSLIEFLGKLLTNKFHHTKRFTKKDILQLANQTSFKILEIKRYGFLPRNSLRNLPNPIKYSAPLAFFWDIFDNCLSAIFSPLCQNYYFVAQKI
ncbi:class I SAM-dependent methyltransferase [Patescibacteria group bacterium]|nr:class I SAM-dependent methyltransferase [Patescibacteria group bacterium]